MLGIALAEMYEAWEKQLPGLQLPSPLRPRVKQHIRNHKGLTSQSKVLEKAYAYHCASCDGAPTATLQRIQAELEEALNETR